MKSTFQLYTFFHPNMQQSPGYTCTASRVPPGQLRVNIVVQTKLQVFHYI
jgi:hypothetical protein